MKGDQILLFILPVELVLLEVTHILNLIEFLMKTSISLIVNLVDVFHELLTLHLSVVIDLVRSLTM